MKTYTRRWFRKRFHLTGICYIVGFAIIILGLLNLGLVLVGTAFIYSMYISGHRDGYRMALEDIIG